MSKGVRVVILAEDERHQRFIRGYLKWLKYSNHEMHFEPLPNGRGCGEQWVRKHYSRAVAAYRNRATRAETALVVAIDADSGDRNDRLRQLDQALAQAGQVQRNDQERIAHFVPKRNIETWVLCLCGEHVDEMTDYRHATSVESKISIAVECFFMWTRPNALIPNHCVLSLRAGVPEAKRLE